MSRFFWSVRAEEAEPFHQVALCCGIDGDNMPESLASSGLTLMLLGMGTVFVFLTALVFATRLMSLAVGRIAPEAAPGPSADPDSTAHSKILDSEILAAITAAIHRHRSRHK